ncbi:MAG TPA: NUDIX domain-containing protein [Flavobacteriales bacterium]
MTIERFNIRVYGLLVHDHQVLVSDEFIRGHAVTKFPGGGLEFGEGTRDGLVREIREELGLQALDIAHFYTTDFFQASAFRSGDQIISIYYTFRVADIGAVPERSVPTGPGLRNGEEHFRWWDLRRGREDDLTLPIDRVVARLLLEQERRKG